MDRMIAVAALCCGCSWAILERPPGKPTATPYCTAETRLPLVDLLGALGSSASAVYTLFAAGPINDVGKGRGVAAVGGVVAAVAYTISASRGHDNQIRCRALRRAHDATKPIPP